MVDAGWKDIDDKVKASAAKSTSKAETSEKSKA